MEDRAEFPKLYKKFRSILHVSCSFPLYKISILFQCYQDSINDVQRGAKSKLMMFGGIAPSGIISKGENNYLCVHMYLQMSLHIIIITPIEERLVKFTPQKTIKS